jgi:tetratricopeptide (TPR) repeat protein
VNRFLAGAIVMSLLLLVYLGFALVYASILLRDDSPIVNAMGVALVVLPILGAWGLVAEWRFGVSADRLRRALETEGDNGYEFPQTPSGRPDRAAAREIFPQFQAAVEAHPDSWQAWFHLGLAYDAAGDRPRARKAIRKAISLHR